MKFAPPQDGRLIVAIIAQAALLCILAIPGVVFLPVLLGHVDSQLMATVLISQIYIHYLVIWVQFGYTLSGPASLAGVVEMSEVSKIWRHSICAKLALMIGPVSVLFYFGYSNLANVQYWIYVYILLIFAYSINSNWFLQSIGNNFAGVYFASFGVCLSVLLLMTKNFDGVVVILILVMPQILLGVGTWYMASKFCAVDSVSDFNFICRIGPLRNNVPLVLSQLILFASSTLGTIVVGVLSDAETSVAYAATEKIFNLFATVLVSLYMALYPKFAVWFYSDRVIYWQRTKQLLVATLMVAMSLAILVNHFGVVLMYFYLPIHLAQKVELVLIPFILWLGICLSQHVLISYFILAELTSHVLVVNLCVLLATVFVGIAFAINNPVDWVYGMVAGQVLVLLLLAQLYRKDEFAHP